MPGFDGTVYPVDGPTPGRPKTRTHLIEQKRPIVLARRAHDKQFWDQYVRTDDADAPTVLPMTDES